MKTCKIFLILLGLAISGCGGNSSPSANSASTLEASQPCIDCHQSTAISSVTGEKITDAWSMSAHNTSASINETGKGAGCGDCHEPDAGHPNSCALCHGGGSGQAGSVPVHNPDSALKCDKCHAITSTVYPLGRNHINPSPLHYTNYTASYLSSQYIGKCRSCHNPHNPSGQIAINREWSESGHGHYSATPWNSNDFKTRGTSGPATPANSAATACVRCHTATGYINYVTSGFKNISAWGRNGVVVNNVNRTDPTKQVLTCPACHDDGAGNSYSFRIRTVPAVTGYYNYSSKGISTVFVSYPYPDAGRSNICICCHSGRETGDSLKAAAPAMNFTNSGFINSHYLTAGATLFAQSGYSFETYEPAFFQHDRIGVNDYLGSGYSGPCVSCHMSSSTTHRFLAVTKADSADKWSDITGISSTKCALCHLPQWNALTLQEKKEGYRASLEILENSLSQRGFWYQERNPYFFVSSALNAASVTNWVSSGDNSTRGRETGEKNMGAAFNLNLLLHDPGGFAHNSGYVRKLIYDSIDWIDDNIINNSVGSTINSYPDAEVKEQAASYLLR